MLKDLKEDFRTHLQTVLDTTIYDTGTYREDVFPFIKIKMSGVSSRHARDVVMMNVSITLDIFSKYTGEQEILEIIDTISKSLPRFLREKDYLTYCYLQRLQILDDNETGPARKHGIATFSFLITGGFGDEDNE